MVISSSNVFNYIITLFPINSCLLVALSQNVKLFTVKRAREAAKKQMDKQYIKQPKKAKDIMANMKTDTQTTRIPANVHIFDVEAKKKLTKYAFIEMTVQLRPNF